MISRIHNTTVIVSDQDRALDFYVNTLGLEKISDVPMSAEYAALTARGVRFKGPVEMMPWGSKATWFSDPDGNEFFLVEESPPMPPA